MSLLILLIIAITVYCLGINKILGLPPGPPPLPLIGNMLSFQWDIDKVFLDWKAKYGRVFTVWLPHPIVVLGDHKVLQEHVVKNGDVFMAKKNPEQLMDIAGGGLYGLVFEDNSMVKEQRKFAMKALHDVGFGSAALEDTVHNYALEITSRWVKAGDEKVDVTENIMRAVGNIVWAVNFGTPLDFDNPVLIKFRELQQGFLDLAGGPLIMFVEFFPFLRKIDFLFGNKMTELKRVNEESNEYLRQGVESVRKTFNVDNTPSCYIEAFLVEQKKREEMGREQGNYHDEQMLMSAASLWGAGFDTTVSILRMCVLELVNHQSVQKRIQDEIDALGERRIRYDDAKLLPYTSAFLQEVYRLANILPMNFLRQTSAETEIEEISIPAGTTILPQFSMVHMDPNEFENPDYFCPERHLNEKGEFVKDPRITPFSLGKRACLGETLARMELFVMLSAFVQYCHFLPVGKVPPPITFKSGFTRQVDEFHVRIRPRRM